MLILSKQFLAVFAFGFALSAIGVPALSLQHALDHGELAGLLESVHAPSEGSEDSDSDSEHCEQCQAFAQRTLLEPKGIQLAGHAAFFEDIALPAQVFILARASSTPAFPRAPPAI